MNWDKPIKEIEFIKDIFQWLPVFGEWNFYLQAGLLLLLSVMLFLGMLLSGPLPDSKGSRLVVADSSLPISDRIAYGIFQISIAAIITLPLLMIFALFSDLSVETILWIALLIAAIPIAWIMSLQG